MASIYRVRIGTYHRKIRSYLRVHFQCDDASAASAWDINNELYAMILSPGNWIEWFLNMLPIQTDLISLDLQKIHPVIGPRMRPDVQSLGLEGIWMQIVAQPSDHLTVRWNGGVNGTLQSWSEIGPLDKTQFINGFIDPIFLPIVDTWAEIHKGPLLGSLGDEFRGYIWSTVGAGSIITSFQINPWANRSKMRRVRQ